jgi:hypothetical protein
MNLMPAAVRFADGGPADAHEEEGMTPNAARLMIAMPWRQL